MSTSSDNHDVIIVGASLAGCTAAVLMARAGVRVLLLEKRPSVDAWKVVCGHYMQSSCIPTIERLGLLDPMQKAGAVRSPIRAWFDDGVVEPVESVPPPINLPRRLLDPMLRRIAAETPGVELRLGHSLRTIESTEAGGVRARVVAIEGPEYVADSQVLVGADGRDSAVAGMAGCREFRLRNGRFNYSPFFTGPSHPAAPATTGYFLKDQWFGAFPTIDGMTGYYLMPTLDRLPEYKRDLEGACRRAIAALPEAPDAEQLELAGPIAGRIDLTNIWRDPVKDGVALVGDAAQAIDPLFGIGCGWAFETGAWAADALAPAVLGSVPIGDSMRRYRRRVRRRIYPHTLQIAPYSRGRSLSQFERFVYRRAARDPNVAERFIGLASRSTSPMKLMFDPREIAVLLRA